MAEATEKRPAQIFGPIVEEGEEKLERSTRDLLLSGLVAGLNISFGAIAMAVVAGRLHAAFHLDLTQSLFWGGLFYPLGFLFVILGRSELFTENTLTPVAGLMRGERHVGKLARYWVIVFGTNIAGTVIFSLIASHVGAVFDAYHPIYQRMGMDLMKLDALQLILAGILAGWLVALIAWLMQSTAGDTAHVIIIYIVAYLITGLGLAHCIVGSTEVLMAMFAGAPFGWGDWLGRFLLPTALGNTLGGVTFVAGLMGFQAVSNDRGILRR